MAVFEKTVDMLCKSDDELHQLDLNMFERRWYEDYQTDLEQIKTARVSKDDCLFLRDIVGDVGAGAKLYIPHSLLWDRRLAGKIGKQRIPLQLMLKFLL